MSFKFRWKEDLVKTEKQLEIEEKVVDYYVSLGYDRFTVGLLVKADSEQRFLKVMPNNVKKRLGIPMTRLAKRGRKTKKERELLIHHVLSQLWWAGAERFLAEKEFTFYTSEPQVWNFTINY